MENRESLWGVNYLKICNFMFLMVRVILPVVNSVIFFELYIKSKKSVYFWAFIVFASLFLGNSLWLVALLFPQYTYIGPLGYAFSAPVELIKESCTLIWFFAYDMFGRILFGKSMTNIEKMVWGALSALMLITVFLYDSKWSSLRHYAVLTIYTAFIWVIMVSGASKVLKHKSKFNKLDFYSLLLIYSSNFVCYTLSFVLLIVHKLGLSHLSGGVLIIAANFSMTIIGLVWVIMNARTEESYLQAQENEMEKMAEDIPRINLMEVQSQYPSMRELQLIHGLTDRESQILGLMLDGKTNEEIGKMLYIALGTVKSHTHNIFMKMNITRRSQLISKMNPYSLKDRSVNM